MRFLVSQTISVIVDPDDDGDDGDDGDLGDSEAEDERAEAEQRTINNRALGPDSIAKNWLEIEF